MTLAQAFLAAAILFEVVATSALKATDGFTRFWPSALTVVGYAFSIYFLALTVKTMPVGIVYAVWSGAGIVLIAAIAWIVFRQAIDTPGLIGIGMILAGVLVVNLFSKTVGH
jgi:small multidrug resistance pump